jgi:hypothetical protein
MVPVNALAVHVNRPELVDDLMRALRRSGCTVRQTSPWSCSVRHMQAADEREAQVELAFFLRAWQTRHRNARALLQP